MKKNEMLKQIKEYVSDPDLQKWYAQNLEGKGQGNTIADLSLGILKGEITVNQGLALAILVGFQWAEEF